MKQKDLIKKLNDHGVQFIRAGGEHDIYGKIGADGNMISTSVPRHREINEITAKRILKHFDITE